MNQQTITRPFTLLGAGIHSGKQTTLHFSAAPIDAGIYFLKEGKKIPALAANVVDTRRGTSLAGIAVVEHLLSAISGLGIDNLEIKIEGEEIPIMDGSALPFVEGLQGAGLAEQAAPRKYYEIDRPVKISVGEAWLEALPYHGLKINFMVNFSGVGPQKLTCELEKIDYRKEIAPARTFGYLEEYEQLKARGLAIGASLDNALVIGKDGYVNQPRFSDEVVRHKVLDLIGDLRLAGRPLWAEINAFRSGHSLNVELVRRIINP
jgi:UDP-3-O-[3-hydroxymyristoyl] N-acetylglucosamine deacetylase